MKITKINAIDEFNENNTEQNPWLKQNNLKVLISQHCLKAYYYVSKYNL